MTPETIGLSRNPEDAGIVMGKHSGRNALSTRLTQLGFDLSPQEVDDVFKRFKVNCRFKQGMLKFLLYVPVCSDLSPQEVDDVFKLFKVIIIRFSD
jgi:hypothetical protein